MTVPINTAADLLSSSLGAPTVLHSRARLTPHAASIVSADSTGRIPLIEVNNLLRQKPDARINRRAHARRSMSGNAMRESGRMSCQAADGPDTSTQFVSARRGLQRGPFRTVPTLNNLPFCQHLAGNPRSVKAVGHARRNPHTGHRRRAEVLRLDHNQLARAVSFIVHIGDEPTVIL